MNEQNKENSQQFDKTKTNQKEKNVCFQETAETSKLLLVKAVQYHLLLDL